MFSLQEFTVEWFWPGYINCELRGLTVARWMLPSETLKIHTHTSNLWFYFSMKMSFIFMHDSLKVFKERPCMQRTKGRLESCDADAGSSISLSICCATTSIIRLLPPPFGGFLFVPTATAAVSAFSPVDIESRVLVCWEQQQQQQQQLHFNKESREQPGSWREFLIEKYFCQL